jgi:hypothetical protein
MNMRYFIILLLFIGTVSFGQSPGDYFNRAANEYIYKGDQLALNTIGTGLVKYPEDNNLTKLKEKIEKEKEDQEKQKNQEQQEQEEQQNKEQEEQENQEQEQQEKEEEQQNQEQQSEEDENAEQKDQAEQANPEETEEEGKEMEEPPQSRSEKLEELNLTEEKARMILEAMKNNEIQYIQQNKRKATKRPDSDKPDW